MRALLKIRETAANVALTFNRIGMLACLASVLIVTIDVVLRKLSSARLSIPGSSELAACSLILMCMLAIPAYQVKNGHIALELLTNRLPTRLQNRWKSAVLWIECLTGLLFAYAGALKVRMFLDTGTSTDVLNIPKWPLALVCLIGFAELTVLLGLDACLAASGQSNRDAEYNEEADHEPES